MVYIRSDNNTSDISNDSSYTIRSMNSNRSNVMRLNLIFKEKRQGIKENNMRHIKIRYMVLAIFLILISPGITGTQAQPTNTNLGSVREIGTGSQSGIVGQGPVQINPVPTKGIAGQGPIVGQGPGQIPPVPIKGIAGQVPPTTINFDDIVTVGASGGGATPVTDQYASKDVTFSGARAVDYSKGMPIPGFAHSGTIAIEACYGAELCTDPIEMVFNNPVSYINFWVGIDTEQTAKQRYDVILRAFDATGQQVAQATTTLDATQGSVPIQTPLQVSAAYNRANPIIVRATVSYTTQSAYSNNGLAIDDVGFSS